MSEFNLIDEPWIPCISQDGNRVEYGIRDTLTQAHDLREICDDSPLVTVSIHRMLLALLYRALQGPNGLSEWKAIWNAGNFQANQQLDDYLKQWHHRFWLFDDEHPFMQVAGLDLNKYRANGNIEKDNTDEVIRLAKEAPDKGGRILFDHRNRTERPDYDPKQIVKMLLAAQNYSGTGVAGGGKVGTRDISPTLVSSLLASMDSSFGSKATTCFRRSC